MSRRPISALVTMALVFGGHVIACSKKDANPPAQSSDAGSAQGKGVRVADFDRACTADTDCIVVAEGTSCCLGCPSAAIAKTAFAVYNTKLAEHRASCKQTKCPPLDCEPFRARCNAGNCEACKPAVCPPPSDASVDSGPTPDGKLVELPGPSGQFDPPAVDIKPNDTVTWVFYEDGHSVVSGASCAADGKFSSGPQTKGSAYSFTFAAAGEYAYHCEAHCTESGVVRVKDTR